MAEYKDREHFIPLRKTDLVELLCAEPALSAQDRDDFRQFCTMVGAYYHFEYHKNLEKLKDAYAPFDPDADTKKRETTPEQKTQAMGLLFEEFDSLMQRANFKHLGADAIEEALKASSDWGINMDVDLNVFERYAIYARGDVTGKRAARRFGFWTVQKEVPVFQRLVMIMKLRPHERLGNNIDTDSVYLRVFKEIPKQDLEMLFPGARPQMSLWDKGNIGVPLVSGVGVVGAKLVATVGLATLTAAFLLDFQALSMLERTLFTGGMGLALMGLIGYGFKSYTGYLNTRNRYALRLTESLFYQTLDGNQGVLLRLVDEAEEQEFREAVLAYFFLWRGAGAQGWTQAHLDDHIEEYLERKSGLKVDFEVEDAIRKLEELQIIVKEGDRLRAVPLDRALERVDYIWDNYFKYNNPESPAPPIPAPQKV